MSAKKQNSTKESADENKSDSSYIESEEEQEFVPPSKN